MTIMLVEDDPALSRGIQVYLESEGYSVLCATTLKVAFEIEAKEKLDLVILDLGLTDGSGFQFLDQIREKGSRLPIIILTAQTDEDTVVAGLQRGANDFMKKPFSNRELVARIGATLREPIQRDTQVRFGDLLILIDQRVVKYKDSNIELNRKEFDILNYMVQRANAIVTREALIGFISDDGEIFDRTIDSHVSHLRSRFKKAGIKEIKFTSVYGIGYRLEKI